MKKIIALTFALLVMFALTACGGKPENNNGSSTNNNGGTVKTSKSTDKWPSGVYNAYGVPEYKAGKIVFAYPSDEAGSVFINTTREELITYVDSLKEKGFHMSENRYEALQTKDGESFSMYFPTPGGKYSLDIVYSWENDRKGNSTEYYDENTGEEVEIEYNVLISLSDHGLPEGWNKKDVLAKAGLTDDKIKIENANKIVDEIELGLGKADPLLVNMTINFTYDYNLTKEFVIDYQNKLIDVCKSIADDGKVTETFGSGELDMEKVKVNGCDSWNYNYQGKKLNVQTFCETGYKEDFIIAVTELK